MRKGLRGLGRGGKQLSFVRWIRPRDETISKAYWPGSDLIRPDRAIPFRQTALFASTEMGASANRQLQWRHLRSLFYQWQLCLAKPTTARSLGRESSYHHGKGRTDGRISGAGTITAPRRPTVGERLMLGSKRSWEQCSNLDTLLKNREGVSLPPKEVPIKDSPL